MSGKEDAELAGSTTHEAWYKNLDCYLDRELAAAQMKELDSHLRECSKCTAEVLRRLQWKRAIHSAGRRYQPDANFRRRIQKTISRDRQEWWLWRLAFAGIAAILLLLAGGRLLQTVVRSKQPVAQEERLAGELADLHVATLASTNPVDVVSSDRHNVKPWFAGKIPFTFDLPDLQPSQFELVGGRVTYVDQAPGAQLLFRIRKHQISAFIFQTRMLPPNPAKIPPRDAQSFHLVSWQRNGLQYFLIGDVAVEELQSLRSLIQGN